MSRTWQNFFTAEDFKGNHFLKSQDREWAAKRANEILREEIEKVVREGEKKDDVD